MRARAAFATVTIEVRPVGPNASVAGARIVVDNAPAPLIVTFFVIDSCSKYVPDRTLIVSPGAAASSAA